MANEKNLKPVRSESEARELGKQGGIASGKARRKKKILRESLEALLDKNYNTSEGEISGADAIALKLMEQAMKGNVRAFTTIRDTIGQQPIQKIQKSEIDPEVAKEVESIIEQESDRVASKKSE